MALAFCGCQTDDFIAPEVNNNTLLPIQLYNEIAQVPSSRVDEGGFCDGDGVGIYVVNYKDGQPGTMASKGNQADNVRFVFNEEEYRWASDYDIYFYDDKTHVDIIGYYPYVNKVDDVNAFHFEVQQKQSVGALDGQMGGYEASDFLWGKAENIAPTASRIKLTFQHRMAGVQVSLIEGTGWNDGEWAQVEKAALVTNTKRKATIDLSTGEITPTGDAQSTGIIP